MAFSQRARAYTLNPTLPCPTLPLSPRALSDSSIIPAAGRLCLNKGFYIPATNVAFCHPGAAKTAKKHASLKIWPTARKRQKITKN